jgi:Glycosyltransferase sugar-binding region containing DXD motif
MRMVLRLRFLKSLYRKFRATLTSTDLSVLFENVGEVEKCTSKVKVFQTWKTSKFDGEHAKVIYKQHKNNPEVKFFLYHDQDMYSFMNSRFNSHPIFQVFADSRYMASKADIWRLCVLYVHGGYYLDIDSTVKFSLSDEVATKDCLISYSQEDIFQYLDTELFPEDLFFYENFHSIKGKLIHPEKLVLNWLMYFEPEHPILRLAIDEICSIANHKRGREYSDIRQAVLHLAGPIVLTRAVWKHVLSGGKVFEETYDFNNQAIFRAISGHSVFFASERYTTGDDPIILR